MKVGCLAIGGGVLALVLLIALLKSFNTIDAGSEGAVVCYGTPTEPLDPGLHLVAPWCGVSGIDTHTQSYVMVAAAKEGQVQGDDSLAVQSADQVTLGVQAAIIYHNDAGHAIDIYRRFKTPEDLVVVLRNIARKTIHDSGSHFNAADLTGGKRGEFGDDAEKSLAPALAEYGIVLERVEVRDVIPTNDSYVQAIAAKVAAQQAAEAKQYQLQAAEKDADVKRAQAKGDADAQAIRNSQPPDPRLVQQQMVDAIRNTQNKVIITDGKAPVLLQQPGG
jgi:regulator of protease activity HflC (stomatin/prohibitin superfamily)